LESTDSITPVPNRAARKRWLLRPADFDRSRFLASELKVHPVVAHLLMNRGANTVETATRFLDRRLKTLHDPADLPGASAAADRIYSAVKGGRRICIYGDYDVDGMCATSILIECLRLAGASPTFYIPDRLEEGYGVSRASLDTIKAQGNDLVVTVDCGITSIDEAEHAREIGLEYIVTDHHEMKDTLPAADAVVHPRLPGSTYPFGQLCGAGVAFKLAWEIARRESGGASTSATFRKFLLDVTSLTAIGTVCDVVPLEGENRALVYHGLQGLRSSPPAGLAYLMRESSIDPAKKLEAEDVAFLLGPRLNACGRLGRARLGVELLTTRDNARAQELARHLDDQNKQRQSLERQAFLEARDLVETLYPPAQGELPCSLVLASDAWHAGIIGIVASRMVERYHRPCVMISLQGAVGTGSARSVPGIHLQQALAQCSDYLQQSGGHEMAAGLRIAREQLEPFREAFEQEVRSRVGGVAMLPDLSLDLEVPLHALSTDLVRSLEVLEPFGVSNPKPIFLANGLTLLGEPRVIGGGGRHLSFQVQQGDKTFRAIAFGQAERVSELADAQGKCSLAFEPIINDFRGYPSVELKVRDFRPGPFQG
jgi:single-stranded-DNA-specific exonuclease